MVQNRSSILVVGGAGYIGSHMLLALRAHGHQVVVLDNLSSGHAEFVTDFELIRGHLGDTDLLNKIFKQYNIGAVMHFAAHIEVGESVENPGKYYQNNVAATLNLLDAMVQHNIKHFIFSSTAAIFGQVGQAPIAVDDPQSPINPYGRSKWMVEQILKDYDLAYGLKSVCLRYFNACGADPEGRVGESHQPESHLIPLILQVASLKREKIYIYGDDYPTPDGTCIRDFVHVCDIASAHLLALEQLIKTQCSQSYNLGNGRGFSVKQVIAAAKQVTGRPIKVELAARRAGDPAVLVADATLTQQQLNWTPLYPDLPSIISHAWAWELSCQSIHHTED